MDTPSSNRTQELELIITWEGAIDNARIREVLGIKPVWASTLLAGLVQSLGARVRRATSHSPVEMVYPRSRVAVRQSPDKYLSVVRGALPTGAVGTLIEDSRIDLSGAQAQVFSMALRAARSQTGLKIVYRSMSTPAGRERVVFPHCLVRAPRRWHVRGWCEERQAFADFALGRIAKAEAIPAASVHSRSEDAGWQEEVALHVVPHPALTPDQARMVSDEHFPGASAMKVAVRACLAKYVAQDLRLATNPAVQLPPEYLLSVANADALSNALWAGAERREVTLID